MNNPDKIRWKLILKYLIPTGLSLDLGSSQGGMDHWLRSNSQTQIVGVDYSNAEIIHDLNKPFPFKKEYAENIIAGEILEHIYEPFSFLKECNRILKKNGRLIITTPNAIGFHYLVNERHGYDLGYTPHLYAWNKTMLKEIVELAGFKVIKLKVLNHFTNSNLFLRFLSRTICFILPQIKPKLFLVAEKN